MGGIPAATMAAAVAAAIPAERLEMAELPRPTVEADDDVILRVQACGICGTDLHILAGQSYRPATPFVLGHEPVGVVVDAGPAAARWVGRRATMTLFTGEGSCPTCRAGDERLCPDLVSITGVLGVWGAYAEYVRVHARQLVEVPADLSAPEAASLVDSGATAANAVRVALTRSPNGAGRAGRRACGPRPTPPAGSPGVLVLGAGPIGHLCAELLRVHSAPVRVVEPSPLRRQALERIGHHVVDSIDAAGTGFDAVIDCTGVPAVMAPGLRALGPRGRYVLAGYARVPELDFAVVAQREIEIRGVRSGRREDLESLIALAADRRIQLPEIAEWRLSEANDALDALRGGRVPGKAVVVPDRIWKERS